MAVFEGSAQRGLHHRQKLLIAQDSKATQGFVTGFTCQQRTRTRGVFYSSEVVVPPNGGKGPRGASPGKWIMMKNHHLSSSPTGSVPGLGGELGGQPQLSHCPPEGRSTHLEALIEADGRSRAQKPRSRFGPFGSARKGWRRCFCAKWASALCCPETPLSGCPLKKSVIEIVNEQHSF